jgi:CheY-like chemotaxis protein
VLLAEDDPDVRAYLVDALKHGARCAVVDVGTGDDALALLHRGARFDLLFTDVRMLGALNGFELAREARRLDARMKIVCATGYHDVAHQDGACDAFLRKPFRSEVLMAVVKALLTSRA